MLLYHNFFRNYKKKNVILIRMLNNDKHTNNSDGNVIFFILLAVTLFAGLTYAVTSSDRGGGEETLFSKGQNSVLTSQTDLCISKVTNGIEYLKSVNGCSQDQISYETPSGSNINPDAPIDESCHLFRRKGAGLEVCGSYVGCDLTDLEIGEDCDGVIYAGPIWGGSDRIYTTAGDISISKWDSICCSHTGTGATSMTDGAGNTDLLVGAVHPDAPFNPAETCRALGPEWHLPARYELRTLFENKGLIGGFNETGSYFAGYYWSSTENSNVNQVSVRKFSDGSHTVVGKHAQLSARCVRRD